MQEQSDHEQHEPTTTNIQTESDEEKTQSDNQSEDTTNELDNEDKDSEETNTDLDEAENYEVVETGTKRKKQQYTGTYRCNLDAMYKVMSVIKKENILSQEAKDFIEKTPFNF